MAKTNPGVGKKNPARKRARVIGDSGPRGVSVRLRQALDFSNVSQKELCRRLKARRGISGSDGKSLREYLRGKREPSLGYLDAVAEICVVRPEWLTHGSGPMQLDSLVEQRNVAEYYDQFLPPRAESLAWEERVSALPVSAETRRALGDLPHAVWRAVEQLGVGEIVTPAGMKVLRPGPAVREAMRLELRAWITVLDEWRDDVGDAAVGARLNEESPAIERRFSPEPPPRRGR